MTDGGRPLSRRLWFFPGATQAPPAWPAWPMLLRPPPGPAHQTCCASRQSQTRSRRGPARPSASCSATRASKERSARRRRGEVRELRRLRSGPRLPTRAARTHSYSAALSLTTAPCVTTGARGRWGEEMEGRRERQATGASSMRWGHAAGTQQMHNAHTHLLGGGRLGHLLGRRLGRLLDRRLARRRLPLHLLGRRPAEPAALGGRLLHHKLRGCLAAKQRCGSHSRASGAPGLGGAAAGEGRALRLQGLHCGWWDQGQASRGARGEIRGGIGRAGS